MHRSGVVAGQMIAPPTITCAEIASIILVDYSEMCHLQKHYLQ